MSERPLLAVTLGDPSGIGPEICLRLLAEGVPGARLLVIGEARAVERARALVPAAPQLREVAAPEEVGADESAALLGAGPQSGVDLPPPGRIDAGAGAACHGWVVTGAHLAKAGRVAALVTGPIHKEAWHRAGITCPGHTELLQDIAGAPRVLMMLVGGPLRVVLATVHVPLSSVAALLKGPELQAQIELLATSLREGFGLSRPRIAVCGLNPHAGEGGLFGDEEQRVITPAVERAREGGVDVMGPLPADACIPAAAGGTYDAVLAMYHDQALPAVKSLAPRAAVNVTLGLPFVRTSVDHGTAFDIAGAGLATPESLRAAVELALVLARQRAPLE